MIPWHPTMFKREALENEITHIVNHDQLAGAPASKSSSKRRKTGLVLHYCFSSDFGSRSDCYSSKPKAVWRYETAPGQAIKPNERDFSHGCYLGNAWSSR